MKAITRLIEEFHAFAPVVEILPAGTRCFFDQDNPPTGWTRDVAAALDDRVIRLVIGARADGGSWTLSGLSMDSHSHSYTDNVVHNHPISVGAHPHNAPGTKGTLSGDVFDLASIGWEPAGSSSTTAGISLGTTGVATGTTLLNSENISSDGSWRPLYRDVIIAEKD